MEGIYRLAENVPLSLQVVLQEGSITLLRKNNFFMFVLLGGFQAYFLCHCILWWNILG
jgi:hypothetical protein